MAKARVDHAAVGVAEHGNSAVLVTVGPGGELLGRRRVDLTSGLPTHPYHHEGSWAVGRYVNSPWARPISLQDAVALVERVREAAARGARDTRSDPKFRSCATAASYYSGGVDHLSALGHEQLGCGVDGWPSISRIFGASGPYVWAREMRSALSVASWPCAVTTAGLLPSAESTAVSLVGSAPRTWL